MAKDKWEEFREQLNRQYAASSCDSTSDPIDTPSHTSAHDTESVHSHGSRSTATVGAGGMACVPEHGGTYMIRDADSEKALALVDRRLTLVVDAGTRGGWHWHCVERDDGWIGFRDAVSGSYLGHNNRGGYIADAKVMRAWECFVLRPREKGGYHLYVKHWDRFKPMGVGDIDTSEPCLVDASNRDSATRWEFVKVCGY